MKLYNGCPDSELKAIWDERDQLMASIKKLEPEAHCTYHSGSGYQVHRWGKPISMFWENQTTALKEALQVLKNGR